MSEESFPHVGHRSGVEKKTAGKNSWCKVQLMYQKRSKPVTMHKVCLLTKLENSTKWIKNGSKWIGDNGYIVPQTYSLMVINNFHNFMSSPLKSFSIPHFLTTDNTSLSVEAKKTVAPSVSSLDEAIQPSEKSGKTKHK